VSKCFHCGKKCKNLKAHTEAKHPDKPVKARPQHRESRGGSIASQVLDAQLRAEMGCPEKHDEQILAGFEE